MARIGFVGVGNMGGGMALNLIRAGHTVRAFDLSEAALARVVAGGAMRAEDVAEALGDAEIVITMLPAGAHVAAVYGDGIFVAAPAAALLIDCSTIDIATARGVAEAAAARGFAMLDAPVSGGTTAADAGTLTFMVGGPANAFARGQPILQAMGKAVIHAGPAGSGQAAKVCNNMLLGITMIGTCEAFNLAVRLGLDPQTFFDISSRASGQSWSMTSYCPVPGPVPTAPSNRDYEGGFQTALMLKDLKLALDAAKGANASVPMGAQAEALYQMFAGLGGATKDFSAMIKLIDGSWDRPAERR
jgi:3-hydroxyisobutyrate dehydrogenase